MSKLLSALQTENSFTENGMTTNSSSLSNCVNLFFQIGSMRGKDKQLIINMFIKAYNENPLVAMKLLFWARDVRGGAGERQIFKDITKYLANNHVNSLEKNISLFQEYGRWDDLLTLLNTKLENQALATIKKGLDEKNGLCAKWMPRTNTGGNEKKRQANKIRKYLGLNPKDYRNLIVGLSNTVEQLMCSKKWNEIEYSKLPSKAMSDYMKAFYKNDSSRFQAYLTSLEKGEVKINAGALYPYDIIKNLKHGNSEGANQQWNALPNYMENNNERIIPLVDVSGSMECSAGNNKNVSCMDVSISLGLYISERNIGPFKDAFITFSSNPQLEIVTGTLQERYNQMSGSEWGMSTNLESAFALILNQAKKHNVPESEMPTTLIILSDMEFNSAVNSLWGEENSWNPTAQQMIESMYSDAGYKMPKIIYWNLNGKGNNYPVSFDKEGTALVSGFSPALLTSLLSGKNFTPESMMFDVINSSRYDNIKI
jgi:hypothetical protein